MIFIKYPLIYAASARQQFITVMHRTAIIFCTHNYRRIPMGTLRFIPFVSGTPYIPIAKARGFTANLGKKQNSNDIVMFT